MIKSTEMKNMLGHQEVKGKGDRREETVARKR